MKITIIGTGYVGLVSGICFAKLGHDVICVDKIATKITQLKNGEIPIFEPGLKELLREVYDAKKISFTTDLKSAVENSATIFIAVGTPQDEDGSADLSYVLQAATDIANYANSSKLIVTKSTVPAGTGVKIKNLLTKTNPHINFLIASNPEFLREGSAIYDFMHPDRIVIGCEDDISQKILSEIYQNFPSEKIVATDIVTAELIKYSSNSFLAAKISFINEMADLCEALGGDIKKLSYAMGLDERIGNKFLNPGPGFGGSCFPKDILAIINIARENNIKLSLIESVIGSNKVRKIKMAQKISDIFEGKIKNKKIALLGLAFKANTDDIRYSPAIAIAKELLKSGAEILAHDFAAIKNAAEELKEFSNIKFFTDPYAALQEADLIVIATEWAEYKLDLEKIKNISQCRTILDLRNIFNKEVVKKAGFNYFYIGGK